MRHVATEGNEIQKTRPRLVVSPDAINRSLGVVTVMPMTNGSHPGRFRVPVQFAGKGGLLLDDEIRSVSQMRLIRKIGPIEASVLRSALALLREMLED